MQRDGDVPPGLIGLPAGPWMWTQAVESFLRLQFAAPPGSRTMLIGNRWDVARKRNEIVEALLRGQMWRWLLFLDSDQTFPEGIIHRLWETSEETGAGIVAAPVAGRERNAVFSFGWVNAFHLDPGFEADDPMNLADDPTSHDSATQVRADDIDRDGEPFEVDMAMTGATLFRREVFEAVEGPPWFIPSRYRAPGGKEDVNFAYRAREAGVKQVVDPRIQVGHVGPMCFTVEDAQMANRAAEPRARRDL